MNLKDKRQLVADIEKFDELKNHLSPIESEQMLLGILQPLLKENGYDLTFANSRTDSGVDFLATRDEEKIGVEYKRYRNAVGASQVRDLIGTGVINKFGRVILLTNSTFSKEAKRLAEITAPISVELFDINGLKEWVSKIEADYDETEIIHVLKTFTKTIIELINRNARILDEIEWRDLERVMAEVFDGLGFSVILTPASKDGGKDIILECTSKGTHHTFIIEIKHWRSTQKVGQGLVKEFVKVVANEKRHGGLFLSTYGFAENAVESMTEIERQIVKFGQERKIVSLCKTYQKRKSGLWQDEQDLAELLFSETE